MPIYPAWLFILSFLSAKVGYSTLVDINNSKGMLLHNINLNPTKKSILLIP